MGTAWCIFKTALGCMVVATDEMCLHMYLVSYMGHWTQLYGWEAKLNLSELIGNWMILYWRWVLFVVSTNAVVNLLTIWGDTWQQSATISNCGFCPLGTSLTNIDAEALLLLTKYWPNINVRDWPEIDKLSLEFIQREFLIWSRSVRPAASRPKSNWFKMQQGCSVMRILLSEHCLWRRWFWWYWP